MDDVPIGALCATLFVLVLLSAFFSASETAMMSLNRYRLRHLAASGHRAARIAERLLADPGRLLGTILLGNNLANNAAAAVATVLALNVAGQAGIAIATGLVTLLILMFAEIPPKTVAALHAERIAFPAVYVLDLLLTLFYPFVTLVNLLGNGLLRLAGVSFDRRDEHLSAAELRTVVLEVGGKIPESHQRMLLRILELENITVDDVMVPRAAIEAIDLNEDWDDIVEQLATSHHTRLPVYRGELDNIVGELHLRKVLHLMRSNNFDKPHLERLLRQPYYVPEGSKLTEQLLVLQATRRQLGLVVDEYGDIVGLIAIEEILEEIVGEFTADLPGTAEQAHLASDGSYLVDGAANLRDLNRRMGWALPTDGPKTLNGLIIETLEDIPRAGLCVRIGALGIEIVQATDAAVEVARLKLIPHRAGRHGKD